MVIDFHSHILPNIDDGSRSSEMSCDMLAQSAQQGVDVMLATPHFYADQMRMNTFLERRSRAYEKIQNHPLRKESTRIICGAEVAFFPRMSEAEELDLLCIENTRLMLVEMPFRPWTSQDLKEIEKLNRRGIKPIIAHLERFYGFQKDKHIIPDLLDMPVYAQLNAECLLTGWWGVRLPLKLLSSGQAHLLGSDSHRSDRRAPNLAEGRAVIQKKLGQGVLDEIDRLGEELLFSAE